MSTQEPQEPGTLDWPMPEQPPAEPGTMPDEEPGTAPEPGTMPDELQPSQPGEERL
jgi:hypothetical protein